jgi:hypothetical protein
MFSLPVHRQFLPEFMFRWNFRQLQFLASLWTGVGDKNGAFRGHRQFLPVFPDLVLVLQAEPGRNHKM